MQSTIITSEPDEVRERLAALKPGSYRLLDVRQAWEYEEMHLPGAISVPLPFLMDWLDKQEPAGLAIVYCQVGGRSSSAARLLAGGGFEQVINVQGGIASWEGDVAYGPMDLGFGAFDENEGPTEIIVRAYAMEQGLQDFYSRQAEQATDQEIISLYTELAGLEDRHKAVLQRLYDREKGEGDAPLLCDALGHTDVQLGEGGVCIEEFLKEYGGVFSGLIGVLELAMMLEAQAYDYYLRCMQNAGSPAGIELFTLLAKEEKAHLRLLGKRMDKLGKE